MLGGQLGTDLGGLRGLVGRPQPADLALGLLGSTLLIERYQPHQQLFLGLSLISGLVRKRRSRPWTAYQRVGEILPAISLEGGTIKLVMEFFKQLYQPLIVNILLFWLVMNNLSRIKYLHELV